MQINFLGRLRSTAPVQEIQDPERVSSDYRYWRIRTFYSMFFGYILYYFTRKSYVFAMPVLMEDLSLDEAQLGLVASALSITYAFSKFFSGVIADRSNPRFFMAIGLIMTGVVNILFGMGSSILFFAIVWGLNGFFQGFGAPPCARLMVHWYAKSERGRWWAAWNTAHNIGGWGIAILAAYCADHWGWRYGLYVPGALCIVGGLFLMERLRDTPESLGLPSVERFSGEAHEETVAKLGAREALYRYVLANPLIWLLAFSYFFLYIMRTAVNDWTLLYFVKEKGYSKTAAGVCVSWFEIGGFFGSLAAGFLSDGIFRGRRGPVNAIFMAGIGVTMLALWTFPQSSPLVDSLLVFASGFFIFGPQLLIGMAAAELAHKQAAGAATGFAGFFGYLGSAVAGYPVGKILMHLGWDGFFMGLIACSGIGVLLLLPMWGVRTGEASPGEAEAKAALV